MKELYKRIKAIRIFKGLKQEDVAQALSIPRTTYRRIETENGQITEGVLNQLADVFNMTVEEIRSYEDAPKSSVEKEIDALKNELKEVWTVLSYLSDEGVTQLIREILTDTAHKIDWEKSKYEDKYEKLKNSFLIHPAIQILIRKGIVDSREIDRAIKDHIMTLNLTL